MKTQEEIYQKIRELENDIIKLKNMVDTCPYLEIKFDYIKSIFKIQEDIALLKWVLEG